ncbi:polysaccharide deacetylase [Acanthocystis turfacea Chlorella virus TN603.4.2]|nr:polysaccharide deacetylase [Acanthocystis turfacea Chlorella virus TN603.4.2]
MLRSAIAFALLATAFGQCALPNCFNPGTVSPLPPEETPQFVLLSHDDEININTYKAFENVGICNSKITFFLMWAQIDCRYVQAFHNAGHEIALHTVNHQHLTGVPLEQLPYEMLGVRDLVHSKCGIPFEDMKGFRAPYLETNENVRKILYEDEYIEYDSTYNPSDYTMAPFTMDSGLVKNSSVKSETWPGLWEIPVNPVESDGFNAVYSMDPGRLSHGAVEPHETTGTFIPSHEMLDLLIENFHVQYNGSRLPFSVNFHTPWMNADGYSAALGEFLEYTRQFEDVYFITFSELIAWMRNPVPLSMMPPKNTQCVPITVPKDSFWTTYGTTMTIIGLIIGPIFVMSCFVLIAQIIFLVFYKNT